MKNDKSPGNDGIAKKFYEFFRDDIRNSLSDSIKKSFISGELSTSQKQVLIKLIEKKDRDKRLIKNWSSISLLNIVTKLISKVKATRLTLFRMWVGQKGLPYSFSSVTSTNVGISP